MWQKIDDIGLWLSPSIFFFILASIYIKQMTYSVLKNKQVLRYETNVVKICLLLYNIIFYIDVKVTSVFIFNVYLRFIYRIIKPRNTGKFVFLNSDINPMNWWVFHNLSILSAFLRYSTFNELCIKIKNENFIVQTRHGID